MQVTRGSSALKHVLLRRGVGFAVAGTLLVCCVWDQRSLLTPIIGCSTRDERLAVILADLPIMAAHPDAATPKDRYSGCDRDDGFAYAGQRYQTESTRESVMSFYRAAAAADGWHADGENPNPVPTAGLIVSASAACFHKEVDGITAYLSVNFPSDLNVPGGIQEPRDLYGIDLSGAHDGAAWC